MACRVTVLPHNRILEAAPGENLLALLRREGLAPDAPCGGQGRCGKCRVLLNGQPVLACGASVFADAVVTVPQNDAPLVLTQSTGVPCALSPAAEGFLIAIDIGTTTVAGCLMDRETGKELASFGIPNPQSSFGADVVSRVRCALDGNMDALTAAIRQGLEEIIRKLCQSAGIMPEEIGVISIVGNPAMQQLFLGICPENLAKVPFAPVLTQGKTVEAAEYLPLCSRAKMLIVPDISGYIGADTVACMLVTRPDAQESVTLTLDIGTNGEMVLGSRNRLAACSAAAGPALEGANIRFGVNARPGAIDRVWVQDGRLCCHVIGGGQAQGICGSGLVDAVAAALELGLINSRGNILSGEKIIPLTENIHLTQEDIRQVQLAKGAIAAGIELLAAHLGIGIENIETLYLAGAFGSHLDPASACRIGLLPPALLQRVTPIGNAALGGAKLLACSRDTLATAQALTERTEFVELAAAPGFSRCFAKNMRF